MTMFSPSLPPVISTTTSTRSPPGRAFSAARARNSGTSPPAAMREDDFRNVRRSMGILPGGNSKGPSAQLVLRAAQDGVGRLADAFAEVRPLGPAFLEVGGDLF